MSRLELKTECSGRSGRLACIGRIVAGSEVDELDAALQHLLRQVDTVDVDLGQVTFLDSSGLGVLVRNLVRARADGQCIRISAMSEQARKTLEMTHVLGHFATNDDSPLAVLAGLQILFVHPSAEIRTFIASLLKDRGAAQQTCASIHDARFLASTEKTDVLILPAEVEMDDPLALKVLRLPVDFFDRQAEIAGEELLRQIAALFKAASRQK